MTRSWKKTILAAILLSAVSFFATAKLWADLSENTNRIDDALCTLRGDLQVRVKDGQKFLKKHPQGIQGISAKDIKQSIDGQKRTIKALSSLECVE